jgi:hypothetical protein
MQRLRHTFCSHLAMRGAPARAIQELAGHQDLTTTCAYMHLSPSAVESAIRLLEQGRPPSGRRAAYAASQRIHARAEAVGGVDGTRTRFTTSWQ